MDSTQPQTTADQAADWLLAVYDHTYNPFWNPDDAHSGVLWHGVYVQPIFTLKSVLEAGKEMSVSARDYADHCRRFL
jgi:hypothetical protein